MLENGCTRRRADRPGRARAACVGVFGAVGALTGVLATSPADAATSLRCGNRLVSLGDSALRLRARCGEPDEIQAFTDVRVLFDVEGRRRERLLEIEEWVYLLGLGDIPRVVRLENGRVRDIEAAAFPTLSRDAAAAKDACRRQLFPLRRTTAAEVRLACGPPDQVDRWQDEITTRLRGRLGVRVRRLITRERWLYNFGENHLLRFFEFANGRLLEMDTGDRGFDPN